MSDNVIATTKDVFDTINWDDNKDNILLRLENILNEVLLGSDYYVKFNGKAQGEHDLDIFFGEKNRRCGFVYLKSRDQAFEISINVDIAKNLQRHIHIKQIQPIREDVFLKIHIIGRYDVDETLNIFAALSNQAYAVKAESIDNEIDKLKVEGYDKEAIVKVRVGQGLFRERLLKRYHSCCLCGIKTEELLVASHIKPWAKSTSLEKLDIDNGFLFCANHDRLFDQGLMTFDEDGSPILSEDLSDNDKAIININGKKLYLTARNKKYLIYHRDNIFQK